MAIVLSAGPVRAQDYPRANQPYLRDAQNSTEDVLEQFRNSQRTTLGQYQEYRQSILNEYESYEADLRSAFADYERQAAVVWGQDSAIVPSRDLLVEYDKEMTERRLIDFRHGTVQVQIALSPAEAKNKAQVRNQVASLAAQVVTQGADRRSMTAVANAPSAVLRDGLPVLAGVVKSARGQLITPDNASAFGQEVADHATERPQTGGDGKTRVIVSAQFPLVSNYVLKLAQRYKSIVVEEAARQRLSPQLVFAVMETESHFNPMARSSVPAFGLMQLVPSAGARDAYIAIHGEDRLVTDTYLYDPRHNIELGIAYLHLIYYSYLGDIHDAQSRLWCTIAAYNTGVDHVLNVFAGRRSAYDGRDEWQAAAIRRINALSNDEVFGVLQHRLPYEETRQYLVNVRKRMPQYSALL